jgi:hypothetical protein
MSVVLLGIEVEENCREWVRKIERLRHWLCSSRQLLREANGVDACTVAALDAITAFAVPNPNCPSQDQSVFSGLVALQVALLNRSLSLLRTDKFYFVNPFSRRRDSS